LQGTVGLQPIANCRDSVSWEDGGGGVGAGVGSFVTSGGPGICGGGGRVGAGPKAGGGPVAFDGIAGGVKLSCGCSLPLDEDRRLAGGGTIVQVK